MAWWSGKLQWKAHTPGLLARNCTVKNSPGAMALVVTVVGVVG